jgi:hypothetical protein
MRCLLTTIANTGYTLYVNIKMIPVETVPGMGVREIKENGGSGEFKYNIRTFVNSTMYPHPAQQ